MGEPARVTVTDFEDAPASALRRVRQGQVIEITSRGQVVARLEPVEPLQAEPAQDPLFRQLGTCEGQFTIADDFDAPLADFADYM